MNRNGSLLNLLEEVPKTGPDSVCTAKWHCDGLDGSWSRISHHRRCVMKLSGWLQWVKRESLEHGWKISPGHLLPLLIQGDAFSNWWCHCLPTGSRGIPESFSTWHFNSHDPSIRHCTELLCLATGLAYNRVFITRSYLSEDRYLSKLN